MPGKQPTRSPKRPARKPARAKSATRPSKKTAQRPDLRVVPLGTAAAPFKLDRDSQAYAFSEYPTWIGLDVAPHQPCVAVSGEGVVGLYDYERAEWKKLTPGESRLSAPVFLDNGRSLLVGTRTDLRTCDLASGKWRILGPASSARQPMFDASQHQFATIEDDGVCLRQLEDGARRLAVADAFARGGLMAVNQAGTRLVTGRAGGATLLDAATGNRCGRRMPHLRGDLCAVAFLSDDQSITTFDGDKLRCWSAAGERLMTLPLSTGGQWSVGLAVRPGTSLVAAGGRKEIWLVDVESQQKLKQLWDARIGEIDALKFSPDGRVLAATTQDGQVSAWLLWESRGSVGEVPFADFSPRVRVRAALELLRERFAELLEVDAKTFAAFKPNPDDDAIRLRVPADGWDKAFDEAGRLVKPFVMRWSAAEVAGGYGRIQVAFARAGLSPELDLAAGTLTLTEAGCRQPSHLAMIVDAFDRLSAQGFWAMPNHALTRSGGWEDAPRLGATCPGIAFWTFQSCDSFDGKGQLQSELHLQWKGDIDGIIRGLAGLPVRVRKPKSEDETLLLEPLA